MTRLRRVSTATPGWSRTRSGRGFRYRDASGAPLNPADIERVRALAIPPAWRDVWICPIPNGHLQATGVDAAGRRQYLYHPSWRARRDRVKFDRVERASRRLPEVRSRLRHDLAQRGLPLTRAQAVAVTMVDLGCFRIGNDAYADANGSFGLSTLERRHVRRHGEAMVFDFIGKSGISHRVELDDPDVIAALEAMRRAGTGSRLLGYRDRGGWHDLTAPLVNAYLAELFDGEFTAKDFRTWHAGVIAATTLALSDEPGRTQASRRRAVAECYRAVAAFLGNTPTIARTSYVDPRIIDSYHVGRTIARVAAADYRDDQERRSVIEAAVRQLLAEAGPA